MAEIFLARQEGKDGFSRDLVVKRILPHLAADPEFKRMFQGEARLAAQLSHPNVVHVYDYGSVVEEGGDETFYLAMELVRGVDLRALIVRAAEHAYASGASYALPPHHAAKIASFVCEALAYAHELVVDGKRANIVHRDVTPSNVLLSFDGAVKLADFGIAKSVASADDGTEHGVVKGKYSYLSPEQARGEPLDQRSDLFNVGILLFESILGQPLFPHQDGKVAKRMSARGEIPDRLRIRRLPGPLADVCERALAPRASDRFPDALAMRADLEAFVRRSAEPSDSVELGRFVRGLFPETVAEDRRAVRAAGTIAKSDVSRPVRAGTAVLEDPAGRSAETALGEQTESDPTLLSSATIALGLESLDPTPPPGSAPPPFTSLPAIPPGVVPAGAASTTSRPLLSHDPTPVLTRPGERSRVGVWIAAALIVVGSSVAAGAMLLSTNDPPAPPSSAPATPPASMPPTLGSRATVAMAQLHVTSDPIGAEVELDGERIGQAPLVRAVRADVEHVVRALDASGSELSSERVTPGEGEVTEVTLGARPVSASLRVASTPAGASVHVDGALLGVTPLAVDVSPEAHHVELTLVGYEPAESDVAFASAGEQAMLSFALRRERTTAPVDRHPHQAPPPRGTGTLRIATDPYSDVFEGRRQLGVTPLQIALPAGTHTLSLRSPGHAPRTVDVVIRTGEVTRLRLSL